MNEYICGTAARFRKKFPNLYERKEKKPVFIDADLLNVIDDIPDAIKAELIHEVRVSRLSRTDFAIGAEDENGYKYYLDIDCGCYYKDDRLLYSVLVVDGARWNIYECDLFGCYNELPVRAGSLNWSKNLNYRLSRIDISAYEREVG
jgi:hypothetical protein